MPPLSPSGAACLQPDARVGLGKRRLVRICLTPPTRACHDLEARTAQWIIDGRLALEARRMIVNSDESIDAIAFALRFQDASNLTQFFRRVTGATPSEFRRIWRGT